MAEMVPPHTISPFHGPETTISTMIGQIKGSRGEHSVKVHQLTQRITREIQPKDYLSEIIAIRNFATEYVRYKNDPLTLELVQDAEQLTDQILRYGKAVGDCDDLAAFIAVLGRQLGREVELVVVGFGAPGKYSHVFTRVLEPKSNRWIVCDPVAGSNEGAMLRRVRTWRAYKIP